jgi:hypothetical protein
MLQSKLDGAFAQYHGEERQAGAEEQVAPQQE